MLERLTPVTDELGLCGSCDFLFPKRFDPIVVIVHDVPKVFVGVRGVFFNKPNDNFPNASKNRALLHNGAQ